MLNNIFPLPIQAGVQAVTEVVIVPMFEASDAWIDDVIALYILGY